MQANSSARDSDSDNEGGPEVGPARGGPTTKKRRLRGACDVCRQKKIKCDSAAMPGKKCTNCKISNIGCSHDAPRQPKKSETRAAYIQSLEEKVKRTEQMYSLLQKLYPDQDVDQILDATAAEKLNDELPDGASSIPDTSSYTNFNYPVPPSIANDLSATQSTEAPDDPEEDDLAHIALTEHLNQLAIRAATDDRFFGQASTFMFIKDASRLKSEITGSQPDGRKYMRPTYWNPRQHEVEFINAPQPPYIYPEPNLLQDLVFLYFEKFNSFFPLLHKPTFLKMLIAGQHHWDQSYGMTVLLVCALGARYSRDPRVLVPGSTDGLSSGWQYFCQVPIHRHRQFNRSTIYDLQYYALASMYIIGMGAPHVSWSIMGLAMRCAIEKGVHRRKPDSSQKPTVDEELLKRAFWCLVFVDRIMGTYLGRPYAVQDEDYDADYPIECDDEYWEPDDPGHAFVQPPGKPSAMTGFVCMLKLFEILGFAHRTLYSTRKSKILSGLTGEEWETRIVAELDLSMSKWKDSLPHFLRWDPEMPAPFFFHQSVSLHVAYNYVQIQIHRPFLIKKSSLSFPSLAMCTNAARSCAHVLEVSLTRGTPVNPIIITGSLVTGAAISLILWGNKRSGMMGDPAKDVANFQICLNILKECEKRWYVGGRAYDMLNEVSFLNEYKSTDTGKRRRDSPPETSEFPAASNPQTTLSPPPSSSIPNYLPSINLTVNNSYNISPTVFGNQSWDFNNLMLAHMSYAQPDLNGAAGSQYDSTNYTTPIASTSQQGFFPTDYSIFDMQDISQGIGRSVGESSVSDDFSLWSDIPNAFSIDEWDRYLAELGR